MNLERRIPILSLAVMVLTALMAFRLIYWQLWRGPQLDPLSDLSRISALIHTAPPGSNPFQELPQPAVQRIARALASSQRGTLLDRNGRPLAFDAVQADGERQRVYPQASLGHVLGYVSGLRLGVTGLEAAYNQQLLGLDRLDAPVRRALHLPWIGSDIRLTLDLDLQQAAAQALAGRRGAVVILDAHSGAVLALASAPGFDPNRMLETGYSASLVQNCQTVDCQGALLNRALQGSYPPGSTFKTLTLIAGLDSGQVRPDAEFDFGKPVVGSNGRPMYVYRVGGGVIPDPNHTESRLSLEMSYARSANAAFAQIGDQMPAERLIDYAQRFGFSAPQPVVLDLPWVPAQLAGDLEQIRTNALLRAATAIGQGEVLASPLQVALLALAVVNNGDLPLPYFVEAVRDPSGWEWPSTKHTVQRGLMKPETARMVRQFMITAVQKGSGQRAAVPGVVVGGKTGTAQLDGAQAPHAWFLGFAESGGRAIVTVVLIENGGEGSQVAAPLFAALAPRALQAAGPGPASQSAVAATPTWPTFAVPTAVTALLTATPQPTLPGLHPADVPRDPGKVDLTVAGAGSCHFSANGPRGTGVLRWPTTFHNRVGGDFSPQHPGIDLGALPGAPILAADDGLAVYSGWTDVGYGNVVMIDHQNGYRTLYAHLSQVTIACGDTVTAGQLIGLAGATGNVAGPHLHFEVRVPDGFVNPWSVLPEP